jgi:hypothetical protein
MLSWIGAAAYLEAQRARMELDSTVRPEKESFSADVVNADPNNDWAPRIRAGRHAGRITTPATKNPTTAPVRRVTTI